MTVVLLFGGVVFLVLAVACFRAAVQGSAAALDAVARKTTRVADIVEGPVELAGVLAISGEPVLAPSGRRCAAVKVTITGRTSSERKATIVGKGQTTVRYARVALRDETGTVDLDLEHAEIVAPAYVSDVARDELAVQDATWTNALLDEARWLNVEEAAIEDGARVLVTGIARATSAEVARADDGAYRGGRPSIKHDFAVGGEGGRRIVVTRGGHAQLLLRSALPVVTLASSGVVFLAHAVAMVVLAFY